MTEATGGERTGRARPPQPGAPAAAPPQPASPPWRVVRPLDVASIAGAGRRGDAAALEALQCITGGGEAGRRGAERLLAHARRLGVGPAHLWSAIDGGGRFRSTAIAMRCPGRTVQVVCARPHDAHEERVAATLIETAFEHLSPTEASLAQSLLEPVSAEAVRAASPAAAARHVRAFESAGFQPLALLDTLVRDPSTGAAAVGRSTPSPRGVSFEPWRSGDTVLHRVLEASYEATMDCPGLRGLRRIEDIVAGHLAGGRYEPSLWSIVRVDGEPAGAVLLSGSHAGDELDLVYLGVAATVRGRGIGGAALGHATAQADARGRRICLAVDRANAPAMRLYARHGFRRVATRLAMIRRVARSG